MKSYLKDIKEWRCEYCTTVSKSKSNLTYHQKTSKRCLLLQDIIKKQDDIKETYTQQIKECENKIKESEMEKRITHDIIEEHIDNLNDSKLSDIENIELEKYRLDLNIEKLKLQNEKLQIELTTQNEKLRVEFEYQNEKLRLELEAASKNDKYNRIEGMFKDQLITFDQFIMMLKL
jgi:hypothetical protein